MKISPKKSTVVHTRHTAKEFTGAHKRPPIVVAGESKAEIPVTLETEQPVVLPEDAVVISENQVFIEQDVPAEPLEFTTEVYTTGEQVVIDMSNEPVPDVVIANEVQTDAAPEISTEEAPVIEEQAQEPVAEEAPVEPEAPAEPVVEPVAEPASKVSAVEQAAEIADEAAQEVAAAEEVAVDKYHYFYCTKSNGQKVTYKRNVNSKYYAQEVEAFKKTLADKGTTIDSEEVK